MKDRKMEVVTNLKAKYKSEESKIKIAVGPGRANLIGGHTDYNMGFVLPCALDKDIILAAAPNQTDKVNLFSLNLNNAVSFSLDDLKFKREDDWANYAKGICYYLKEAGHEIGGIDGVLHGTVPIGGGMSSSAALETSVGYIFQLLFNLDIPPLDLIKIAFRAEREFVGVQCGIMDQYVSVAGVKNSVIFIDCRSLDHEVIKMPSDEVSVVILHTNIKRAAGSALNDRKNECFEAVKILQKHDSKIEALRDVTPEFFEKYKGELPKILQQRAEHVIYENQRVIDAKQALLKGDLELLGKLMLESHQSLTDLYGVGIQELDAMIKISRAVPGVIGSRMTGAGLGGAVVSLVEKASMDELMKEVLEVYPKLTNKQPLIYNCTISDGVKEISL